jgi:hypothetical protein
MENEITRITNILAGHIGMSPETVTLLALESYLTKRNGAHLLRVKPDAPAKPARTPKPPKPARLANGPHEFAVESFTPVPKSNIHTLIVASESGDRFAFNCGGSDWPPLIRTYAPSGSLRLICYGGRPTKFATDTGAFPLDPIPLPVV